MADNLWSVTTGSTALVAATAKTAIELATGSGISNFWVAFDVTFDGTTASAVPALVEIITTTATGTGTAITFAAAHRYNVSATYNPVSTAKVNLSVEGSTPTVIAAWRVPPTGGFSYQWPLGREFGMPISSFKGIRITAAAVVNYVVNLTFGE
jgi:hypothetical protein